VGHIGPPYIATLTLPGLTIGLPFWLFSTPLNVNYPSASCVSTPPQYHQPHIDVLPSSLVRSSSRSSSSSSEISITSNQVAKKKKKRKIKKKKNKIGGKIPNNTGHVGRNQPAIVHHVGSVDNVNKSTKTHCKTKFSCRICKSDHLIKDFPSITKVVEMWSQGSQPASSIVVAQASENPSTSDNQVGSKKGKVKTP